MIKLDGMKDPSKKKASSDKKKAEEPDLSTGRKPRSNRSGKLSDRSKAKEKEEAASAIVGSQPSPVGEEDQSGELRKVELMPKFNDSQDLNQYDKSYNDGPKYSLLMKILGGVLVFLVIGGLITVFSLNSGGARVKN